MLSTSHVLCFSFLLSVLLGVRLISSKKDELMGISDSLPMPLSMEGIPYVVRRRTTP